MPDASSAATPTPPAECVCGSPGFGVGVSESCPMHRGDNPTHCDACGYPLNAHRQPPAYGRPAPRGTVVTATGCHLPQAFVAAHPYSVEFTNPAIYAARVERGEIVPGKAQASQLDFEAIIAAQQKQIDALIAIAQSKGGK
jgi:hypothetical protein